MKFSRNRFALAGAGGVIAATGAIAMASSSMAAGGTTSPSATGTTSVSSTVDPTSTSTSPPTGPTSTSPVTSPTRTSATGDRAVSVHASPAPCVAGFDAPYRSTDVQLHNDGSSAAKLTVTFGSYGRKGDSATRHLTLAPGKSSLLTMVTRDASTQVQLQVVQFMPDAGDTDPYVPIYWALPGGTPNPTVVSRVCQGNGSAPTGTSTAPGEPPTPSPVTTTLGVTG